MSTFYSNGKLLLTGEYAVLDGALSLALPTKKGQLLTIETLNEPKLIWRSLDADRTVWFEGQFLLPDLKSTSKNPIADALVTILKTTQELAPNFLTGKEGYKVTTSLDFPRNWGLGSSSTLINNIANWAKVDAYKLLDLSFGGSGYDIACAKHPEPITYQLTTEKRIVKPVCFKPKFSKHLYFVYLNKKQNSREGIAHYRTNKTNLQSVISKISAITKLMLNCDSLITFQALMEHHETTISKLIQLPTVKDRVFSDFEGAIKSLGAWGGDFVLAASKTDPSNYFASKGFTTIISYQKMILD